MRVPRHIDLEITANCNLRCRYCYFFSNPAVEYRDLPTEEWLQFFDELGALGVMTVTFIGGEPFTRADLPALIEGVVRNRMRFSILSNGGLIDDEMATFIQKTGRCDYVQISVDGGSAQIHDAARGKGSFEGAVRGIRILQRHGVQVAVRLTIHRYNVDHLEEAARFLLEELGLRSFGTNSAGYLGNCQYNAERVMLTTAERVRAMQVLLRLERQYPGRISATAGPLAEARHWSKMETARRAGAPPFPNGGRLTACGCASSNIAVRSDGTITPCTMLAHSGMGRINRDPLQQVWLDGAALNGLRQRRIIPLENFEFCAGCAYRPYCTGNCPGLAYSLTGQVDQPSPDACLRLFLADGGSLEGLALDPA
jgi:SynChlorMet cassette radical SAM/SPASM protein ScmE